jgi:hypothetical protein
MAYYNGSAVDMAAVRSALVTACTSEGWSWNGSTEVLSKGTLFVRLQVVSGYLALLGRTSASSGDAPNAVRMGQLRNTPVTYPLAYHLFVFETEVFMVINYSVDYYQFCAFGLSSTAGLAGTGMWIAATLSHTDATHGVDISPVSGGAGGLNCVAPAPFWGAEAPSPSTASRNCWLHSDIDGQGWLLAQSLTTAPVGIKAAVPLIGLLPNSWNSEAVLLPIRVWKQRASSKISLTGELQHARYTRVDNYEPGQVISIGPDRWKIFPFYRRDTVNRNGGGVIDHSGTLGWAIRYEGP